MSLKASGANRLSGSCLISKNAREPLVGDDADQQDDEVHHRREDGSPDRDIGKDHGRSTRRNPVPWRLFARTAPLLL